MSMKKEIAKVESEISKKNYVISLDESTGEYSCNCLSFIYRKSKDFQCKHIKKFLKVKEGLEEELASKDTGKKKIKKVKVERKKEIDDAVKDLKKHLYEL